jgi:hypothetical protein
LKRTDRYFKISFHSQMTRLAIKAILASEGDEGLTPDAEDAFYIRRLDGGLFTLQTVDYILGWLIMEDDGVSLSLLIFLMPHLIPSMLRFKHTHYVC